jgi:hypothetical protein
LHCKDQAARGGRFGRGVNACADIARDPHFEQPPMPLPPTPTITQDVLAGLTSG